MKGKSGEMNTKQLVLGGLLSDIAAVKAGAPEHVVILDARGCCVGSKRATPAKPNGKAAAPDRVTLAVPPEVLLSIAGGPKAAKFAVMLVVMPMEMAREIYERTQSRIILPPGVARP